MSRSPVSSNASRRRGESAVISSSTASRSVSLERLRVRQRLEIAVQPHDRRLAELEVHVARAALDGALEEGNESHVENIGTQPLGFSAWACRSACVGSGDARAARGAAAAGAPDPVPRSGGGRRRAAGLRRCRTRPASARPRSRRADDGPARASPPTRRRVVVERARRARRVASRSPARIASAASRPRRTPRTCRRRRAGRRARRRRRRGGHAPRAGSRAEAAASAAGGPARR